MDFKGYEMCSSVWLGNSWNSFGLSYLWCHRRDFSCWSSAAESWTLLSPAHLPTCVGFGLTLLPGQAKLLQEREPWVFVALWATATEIVLKAWKARADVIPGEKKKKSGCLMSWGCQEMSVKLPEKFCWSFPVELRPRSSRSWVFFLQVAFSEPGSSNVEIPSGCAAGGVWAHSFPDLILLQFPSPFWLSGTGPIYPWDKQSQRGRICQLPTERTRMALQNPLWISVLRNLCGEIYCSTQLKNWF